MKAVTLLYHDIVKNSDFSSSGFKGSDADFYKLDKEVFINQIQMLIKNKNLNTDDLNCLHSKHTDASNVPFYITFDDGGISFNTEIASILESVGWRGIFFISTQYIDSAGFMTKHQIQDLHKRGHVIGSHSCTHPRCFSDLTLKELQNEWGTSKKELEHIISSSVSTASVPGGFLSKAVIETAESAGYLSLFTSEPQTKINHFGKMDILGRYCITQATSNKEVMAYSSKNTNFTQVWQYLFWNFKKLVKKYLRGIYAIVRMFMMDKRQRL